MNFVDNFIKIFEKEVDDLCFNSIVIITPKMFILVNYKNYLCCFPLFLHLLLMIIIKNYFNFIFLFYYLYFHIIDIVVTIVAMNTTVITLAIINFMIITLIITIVIIELTVYQYLVSNKKNSSIRMYFISFFLTNFDCFHYFKIIDPIWSSLNF